MNRLAHNAAGDGQVWWTTRKSGSPSTPCLPWERRRGRHTGKSLAHGDQGGAVSAPSSIHPRLQPFVISHTGTPLSSFYTRFRHITHGAIFSSFHPHFGGFRHITHGQRPSSYHTQLRHFTHRVKPNVISHTKTRHFTHRDSSYYTRFFVISPTSVGE